MMFKKRVVQFAAMALLTLAASCGDDSGPVFELAASINGATFKAGAVEASNDSTYLSIVGAQGGTSMSLHVAVPVGPATVALDDTTGNGNFAAYAEGLESWSTVFGGSGSVTFTTSNSNEASGTFTYIAQPDPSSGLTASRTVTNGTFRVRY